MLEKAKEKHFQIACTRYFEAVHGKADHSAEPINHPNQYFSDSAQHYGYEQQQAVISQEENINNNIDGEEKNPSDNKKLKTELDDNDVVMVAANIPPESDINGTAMLNSDTTAVADHVQASEPSKSTPTNDVVVMPASTTDMSDSSS